MEGKVHFPLFQVARVTCAARFDIEPVGHCPHCPLPLPHPMQSAQSSTLEKSYNVAQCPNIRVVVAWAVRHNTGHFPTLQCRRDNKGPFPCRFPIFHARLCVWLQLLAMSNMCAWIFPRDIVEVDIFKGRSDPRIGGGSPTSLLRPRVGGRTRPSEFFLTSAPSACWVHVCVLVSLRNVLD